MTSVFLATAGMDSTLRGAISIVGKIAATPDGRSSAPMTSADAPLFSVVIPTCHRNDALAACLERLAPGKQSLAAASYEVIVTDDGSRATSEAMLREKFPWAKWMAGPRRGPAANRNHGAKHANGNWIAFADDDCLQIGRAHV